ncbi:hypothetical protein [Sphingomonas endophytica]|nr:hypothetical protein [Sphingomonas endophytica]
MKRFDGAGPMFRHPPSPFRWTFLLPARVWLTLADAALYGARLILRSRLRLPRLLSFSMTLVARCSRACVMARHHRAQAGWR